MSSLPLTVLITCKNERQNIIGCLASAEPIANELLIGDSGSTDGTLQLVDRFLRRKTNWRVISREYVNSGNFKNWCIPQAAQPWVFIMDADERLGPRLAESIRKVVESNDVRRDGYWVHRTNYFQGRRVRFGDWGSDRVIRLIRRDVGRYREYTDHSEIELPTSRVATLKGRLSHHSFEDFHRYLDKLRHYARQQAELWHSQGRGPSLGRLVTHGAARFLRSYFLRGGFMDGTAGFQLAMHTAYYSFLKQAELWALHHEAARDRAIEALHVDPPGSDAPAPRRADAA